MLPSAQPHMQDLFKFLPWILEIKALAKPEKLEKPPPGFVRVPISIQRNLRMPWVQGCPLPSPCM